MRIAIVSKATQLGGGASKVAQDLANYLQEKGHYVHHYRRNLEKGYTQHSTSMYGKYEWIAKKTFYKLKYFGFQEIIPWEYLHLIEEIKHHKYDIVHFHDLTTAVSPFTLKLLSRNIPVVWTMHDTSPFTGGCINPFGCDHFTQGCYDCPQKGNWPMDGHFHWGPLYQKIKKYIHQEPNIHLISPSQWLIQMAKKSHIIQKDIHLINNCVNQEIFKALDKNIAKQQLGIQHERFTIVIAAGNVSSKTKGVDYALKILAALQKRIDFKLVLIGAMSDKVMFAEFDYISSGYTTSTDTLNLYFNAADIFLNCSLGDNFPLVVLESLASGTPVIGFKTGGIPEMIDQNINGFLSEIFDTQTLIEKIEEIYHSKIYKKWSIASRQKVEQCYSKEMFTSKHEQLYTKLLQEAKL